MTTHAAYFFDWFGTVDEPEPDLNGSVPCQLDQHTGQKLSPGTVVGTVVVDIAGSVAGIVVGTVDDIAVDIAVCPGSDSSAYSRTGHIRNLVVAVVVGEHVVAVDVPSLT